MGSLRKLPAIPVEELVERYGAGEPISDLSLRAKLPSPHVRRLLVGAGVELRTVAENNRLRAERRNQAWLKRIAAAGKLGSPKD